MESFKHIMTDEDIVILCLYYVEHWSWRLIWFTMFFSDVPIMEI